MLISIMRQQDYKEIPEQCKTCKIHKTLIEVFPEAIDKGKFCPYRYPEFTDVRVEKCVLRK